MWSLGALLELEDRSKLEAFALSHHSKLDWPKCNENETVFEYVVNPDNGRWEHWSTRVETFVYPTDSVLEFTGILVPNVDNVRTAFLIHNIAKQNKAVLLIGILSKDSYTYFYHYFCRRTWNCKNCYDQGLLIYVRSGVQVE